MHYDLLAAGYDLAFQMGTFFQGSTAKKGLLDFLEGHEIVLDVGCGTGDASVLLAKNCRKVIGLDYSRSMLNIAKKRARARGVSNVEFIQGDAFRLPFESASFDFVCTTFFFCEFGPEDVASILSEMLRVLKRGGKLGIVDESCSGMNLVHSIHLFSHKLLGQASPYLHDLPSLLSANRVRLLDERSYCFNFLTSVIGLKARAPISGNAGRI